MLRKKGAVNQVLQKAEVSQRIIFAGVEKGAGGNENNVTLAISEDRTDQWCQ